MYHSFSVASIEFYKLCTPLHCFTSPSSSRTASLCRSVSRTALLILSLTHIASLVHHRLVTEVTCWLTYCLRTAFSNSLNPSFRLAINMTSSTVILVRPACLYVSHKSHQRESPSDETPRAKDTIVYVTNKEQHPPPIHCGTELNRTVPSNKGDSTLRYGNSTGYISCSPRFFQKVSISHGGKSTQTGSEF